MIKDITHLVERLDTQSPVHNCAGCRHLTGNKCVAKGALLQMNPHRPTDCKYWEAKDEQGNVSR